MSAHGRSVSILGVTGSVGRSTVAVIEELRAGGVGPEMIRLSIGLETLEDLLWDLDQALSAISE